MPTRSLIWRALLASGLTLSFLSFGPTVQAQSPAPKWESSVENETRYLKYSASATLLGKPALIRAIFYCNPVRDKVSSGALGFDLHVAKVATLAPFAFSDFEGPDAAVPGKAMRVTISRAGQPDLTFDMAPNGSSPEGDDFTFGVAEASYVAVSEPKSLLKALAAGADAFKVVITDPRKKSLQLVFTVPVTGKAPQFQSLLAGVK